MRISGILSARIALIAFGILFVAACSLAPLTLVDAGDASSTTTGSGSPYKTTVERKTEGELSDEDFQQVSLLGTRIVKHINRASENLVDEQHDKVRSEIEKAQTLAKVIREMLPVTVVKTVVRDSRGKEVYHNTDRVQDDQIPVFEGRIAVEVMEPVLDAKKETAAVKGIRLADADLIHTSVLLDLSYVERKLKRCLSLLEESPENALAQLALAQTTGVRLSVNKEDHPLVEAQSALRVAQRMVEQESYEAANANLTLARNHLELYRGLAGNSSDERVKKLDGDIAKVMSEIKDPGAAKKIAGFWDRLTAWFKKESGETRTTEEVDEEKETAGAGEK